MLAKLSLFVVATFVVFCESAYVDTLNKCQISDNTCTKNWIQKVLADIGSTGVPEIEMPAIDPLALANVNVNILNNLDITLIEGFIHGVKDCVINEFSLAIENKNAFLKITCDLVVEGKYKLVSDSPLIKGLTGGKSVHGEGVGELRVEKLNVNFHLFYDFVKKGEETFIDFKGDKTKFEYTGPENFKFDADNLYIGDVESSKTLVALLNENSKAIVSTFGDGIFGKAIEIIFDYVHKFFDKVATNHFITDDLSSYVS